MLFFPIFRARGSSFVTKKLADIWQTAGLVRILSFCQNPGNFLRLPGSVGPDFRGLGLFFQTGI